LLIPEKVQQFIALQQIIPEWLFSAFSNASQGIGLIAKLSFH
jgi:hypothetical protein